jgi:hypothetical protein
MCRFYLTLCIVNVVAATAAAANYRPPWEL